MGSSDLHLILRNPSALNQLHQFFAITEFYDQKMIITINVTEQRVHQQYCIV